MISHIANSDNGINNDGPVTSVNLAVGTALSAGNTIIGTGWSGGGTSITITVTDNNKNVYVVDQYQSLASDGDTLCVFHADSISVTPNNPPTLTISTSASSSIRAAVSAYSGLAVPSRDTVNSANGTSASPSSGSITPSTQYSLIFCAMGNAGANSTSIAAGTGFTLRQIVADTVSPFNQRMATEDQIVTSSTSVTGAFTQGISQEWGCIVVSYRGLSNYTVEEYGQSITFGRSI